MEASVDGVTEQEGMPVGFCLLARILMSVQLGVGAWGLSPEMNEELLKVVGSKGNKKRRGNLHGHLRRTKRNRRRR